MWITFRYILLSRNFSIAIFFTYWILGTKFRMSNTCEQCNHTYPCKYSLKKHMKDFHGKIPMIPSYTQDPNQSIFQDF